MKFILKAAYYIVKYDAYLYFFFRFQDIKYFTK